MPDSTTLVEMPESSTHCLVALTDPGVKGLIIHRCMVAPEGLVFVQVIMGDGSRLEPAIVTEGFVELVAAEGIVPLLECC